MQVIAFVLLMAVGIVQVWAGAVGANYYMGAILAGLVVAVCFLLRFMLPLTIFGFLGAVYVWEWPWWGALLLVAPGLLVAVPSMLAQVLGAVGGKRFARP